VTPGNAKRVLEALQTNIAQYEDKFGTINVVEPGMQKIH
jgi:hypothetical protein